MPKQTKLKKAPSAAAKVSTLKAVSEPSASAFSKYKHLHREDQLTGLRQRAAQLEAEHMSQSLRLLEIHAVADGNEDIPAEQVEEMEKSINIELAAIDKRLALIERLIDTYDDEEEPSDG